MLIGLGYLFNITFLINRLVVLSNKCQNGHVRVTTFKMINQVVFGLVASQKGNKDKYLWRLVLFIFIQVISYLFGEGREGGRGFQSQTSLLQLAILTKEQRVEQ